MPTTVTGTPGDALFLDPSVAGGITTVKPTTIGQIIRGLGTLIDSGNTMYFDIAALAEEITSISSFSGLFNSGVLNFSSAGPGFPSTVIAHGLGVVPSRIKITALEAMGSAAMRQSFGTYDGTNTNTLYSAFSNAGLGQMVTNIDTTYIVYLYRNDGGAYSLGLVTMDATNITIDWSNSLTSADGSLLWEAQA